MSHFDPKSHLPLTPAVFSILLALAEGERHGYAIMQEVLAMTEGTLHLGPGTLYGTLKRLLTAGLVQEVGERSDPMQAGERRRYYRLTDQGRQVVEAEALRLESLVSAARARHALPSLKGKKA